MVPVPISTISTISVIIPVSSNLEDLPVLSSLKSIDYPKVKIEIILAIGKMPSVQRNHAVRMAKGDILYFFNRDGRVEPDIFKKVVNVINGERKIVGVGGPDITPADNNYMQHLFGYAMGSYFAHWKMRARYWPVGVERYTDEKELLLSNIAIKKDIFLKLNGFNEKLYPNEENELISRITKLGYKFIYSPDIKIYRDRRKTLFMLARQFYRYGQGRMNQVFIEGVLKNFQFFMPIFLLIYLLILPFVGNFWISFVPLFMYIILGIMDAAYLSFKNKKNLILQLPIIYMIMHISYALGMIGRLLLILAKTKYSRNNYKEVKVKKIKSFDNI